jgi:hypothetical protein
MMLSCQHGLPRAAKIQSYRANVVIACDSSAVWRQRWQKQCRRDAVCTQSIVSQACAAGPPQLLQEQSQQRARVALSRIAWTLVYAGTAALFVAAASSFSGAGGLFASTAAGTLFPQAHGGRIPDASIEPDYGSPGNTENEACTSVKQQRFHAGSARIQEHIAVTSAASGLAAGFLHTLCGPDHLAVR